MLVETRAAQIGRIGGLTAWSRHDAETMQGAARRAFRERFLNLVDPERVLPTAEREVRADRARRAYMLSLAAKSAAARKRPGPDRDSGRARADGSPHDRPPS